MPRTYPEVGSYWNDEHQFTSSGQLITTSQGIKNAYGRNKGTYRDPPGATPPFFAFGELESSRRVTFLYLSVLPQGTLNVQTNFSEDYFRGNLLEGINLVSLRGNNVLELGTIEDPRNPNRDIRKFAIGVIRDVDLPRGGMDDLSRLTRRD